jgi:quinol monooxygenase YgiN
MKRLLRIFAATTFAAVAAAAQTPTGIVDMFVVKVKPDKRMDFDAVGKKIAEANRKNKGDRWIAYSVEYGEQNTVMFSSVRENYAAIDAGGEAFMSALKEAYGPTFPKLFQDMSNCTISARAEVRRRRMDLSWNVPSEQSEIEKLVGSSKWIRYRSVRTRAGHGAAYEDGIKMLKAALEKSPSSRPTFVSQSMAGQPQGIYYFTTFGKSLGDFDPRADATPLRELMGAETYDRFQKASMDEVAMAEWTIARIVPELSNPPDGIVDANPEFWHPKAAMPRSTPKAKPAPAPTKSGM